MKKSMVWGGLFIAFYAVHALFYLAYEGHISSPVSPAVIKAGAIASLIVLTLLVIFHVARQDEVLRMIAMKAGALSVIVTGFFSYGINAFNIEADYITSNLWAFAIAVFLITYGALSWLGRS